MDSNFLSGMHPKIVHFPVAFLSAYSVLEIAGISFKREFISKSALLLLSLGIFTGFLAVITGKEAFCAFQMWTNEGLMVLNEHQKYATFLLWFSLIGCILRFYITLKNKFSGYKKLLFIIFSFIILFLVYKTAEHGGKLVTKFGVGIEMNFQRNGGNE
jgi:uncharacterized membrane protein